MKIVSRVLLLFCFVLSHWLAFAGQWVDAVGRSVALDAPPQRIVSLVPSVTEILFALGAGEKLVGVTDYCNYPAEARQRPQIGAYAEPNLEAIIAARPDIIFAAADGNRRSFVERLDALGFTTYVTYPKTLDDVVTLVVTLGEVAGHVDTANALAEDMRQRIERVHQQSIGKSTPRTLITVMLKPLYVAGTGTMADDLLRIAGGVNSVPLDGGSYPTWGIEGLLQNDPEVIIVSPHPADTTPDVYFQQWPQLQAVQQQRVYSINVDWLHRPSPRVVLGLEALHRALHGGE